MAGSEDPDRSDLRHLDELRSSHRGSTRAASPHDLEVVARELDRLEDTLIPKSAQCVEHLVPFELVTSDAVPDRAVVAQPIRGVQDLESCLADYRNGGIERRLSRVTLQRALSLAGETEVRIADARDLDKTGGGENEDLKAREPGRVFRGLSKSSDLVSGKWLCHVKPRGLSCCCCCLYYIKQETLLHIIWVDLQVTKIADRVA